MPRRLSCALALLAVALLGGCDTDNPSTPLEEVAGVYAFTELRFDPTASAIADADVLDRLVASSTSLEVFGTGPALLRYQFEGESTVRADVNVAATRSTVQMTAASETDAARLARILLPGVFTLSRGADESQLTGQFSTTVDLAAFDPEVYGGVPPVTGTLHVTLDREADGER